MLLKRNGGHVSDMQNDTRIFIRILKRVIKQFLSLIDLWEKGRTGEI